MTWVLRFEKPPMRGMTQAEYEEMTDLIDALTSLLKRGYIIRYAGERPTLAPKAND